MSSTPPGWFDDGHGALRWWDGAQWTEHIHTDAAPAAPSPASTSPSAEAYLAATAPAGPPRKKSNMWIVWVVIGVIVLGGVISAAIFIPMAIMGMVGGGGASADSDDEQAAVDAVELYDDAWNEVDCDKFMESTTSSFRELVSIPDCAAFDELATSFTEATDDYEITVTDIEHEGATIVVSTTESYTTMVDGDGAPLDDPEAVEEHYTYVLVPAGDGWAIDDGDSE